MDSKSLAAETCSRYFSLVDSSVDHSSNVMNHLKLLVLEVTSAIILQAVGDDRSHHQSSSSVITVSKRGMARLDAFIDGVSSAIPSEPLERTRSSRATSSLLTDAKFRIFPFLTTTSTTTQQQPSVETMNHLHSSKRNTIRRYVHRYPQIDPDDLCTRLLLYIRSIQRIYNSSTTSCRNNTTAGTRQQQHHFVVQECNAHQEPCRLLLRTRVDCICRAFVANVSCITSVQPVLLTLLGSTTRELLAVSVLAEDLWKAMKRVSVEYEMKTSFASVAFLSSPQQSAQSVLFPLVVSYLKYVRNDWRRLVFACQVEEVLSASINPILRQTFKGTEFTSIGHMLQVIHNHRELLNNISLPSFSSFNCISSHLDGSTAYYEDDSNNKDIKQALVDLRREVITVNGIILSAPAHSKNQLVQILCDALHHQINPASTTYSCNAECKSVNCNEKAIMKVPSIDDEEQEQHSTDVSSDDSSVGSSASTSSHNNSKEKEKKRRFDLKTIDKLTLRLLMASCRTGAGGDAFFVIQDLFGDEDVVVVPSAMTSARRINKKTKRGTEKMIVGTIEIIVLLSSVVIKVHGRYSVFPRNHSTDQEFCEPLIQLHTTTSETIALQTIRVCDCGREKDSDGNCSNGSFPCINEGVERHSQGSMEDGTDAASTLLLKERMTETTGNRILSIKPARYKKVFGLQI